MWFGSALSRVSSGQYVGNLVFLLNNHMFEEHWNHVNNICCDGAVLAVTGERRVRKTLVREGCPAPL